MLEEAQELVKAGQKEDNVALRSYPITCLLPYLEEIYAHVSMALYSAKPVLSEIVFGRLVYTIAGGTGIGNFGCVRWEISGLHGVIDDVKEDVQGVYGDVQAMKETIARISGQQEAILKLLGEKYAEKYGSSANGQEQSTRACNRGARPDA